MSNPWKQMTPMLKKHGYTEEQIAEMTMAELFEIIAQNE
jgi:broad-specificity NMP kinase